MAVSSSSFPASKRKVPLWPFITGALLLTLGAWVSGVGSRDMLVTDAEFLKGAQSLKTIQVGTTEPPSKRGKYGGTFTDATLSDPKTFNIWVATDNGSFGVGGALFDSLITRNLFTNQWQGRLCDLPTVSNGGKTYVFRLKPNLVWSDGQPITADDLMFTLDMIYDPKTAGIMREGMLVSVSDKTAPSGFKQVPTKYKKLDDRSIQFDLPVPYAPALSMLNIAPAPKHRLYDAWKSGHINTAWNVSTPPDQLVSSSPWIMKEYVAGQRVVYERNPRFWKANEFGQRLPFLDRYVQLIVPDLNTMTLKFKSGELDTLTVPAPDYPSIKRDEDAGNYTVYNLGPSFSTSYLGFNLNPQAKVDDWKIRLFSQTKFRQAVSYAINRDLMSVNLFRGLAVPAWSYESPANKAFYNANVPKYLYNPKKAGELLDEIGAKAGSDGSRTFEGHPLEFSIQTNVENDVRKSMGIVITRDLKNVGINATFTPLAFNKVIGSLDAAPYQWDAVILGFTGGIEPHDGANIWYSSGETHQWHPKQKTPATPWEAKIDDLFRRGAQELDPVKRKKIYDEWQQIASTQLPFIYTVVPNSLVAIRNRFGNLKPHPQGAIWNQEEIYDLRATRQSP